MVIDGFLISGILPDPIEREFIDVIDKVLSGLKGIPIRLDDFFFALKRSGGTASPNDLKTLFNDFIDDMVKTENKSKIRFILE